MRFCLTLCYLAIIGALNAATTLNVSVDNCESTAATGTITIFKGGFEQQQKNLQNGSATFTIDLTSGLSIIGENQSFNVSPNPASLGFTNIEIDQKFINDGKIRFFSTDGRFLGDYNLDATRNIQLLNSKGIIIFEIENALGVSQSGRIISYEERLNVNILPTHTNALKSIQAADYTIVYEGVSNISKTVLLQQDEIRDVVFDACNSCETVYDRSGVAISNDWIVSSTDQTDGGSNAISWYGGSTSEDKHIIIYYDDTELFLAGDQIKLTIDYTLGLNNGTGLNESNSSYGAIRFGLFDAGDHRAIDDLGSSNAGYRGYEGYFGVFSVLSSNTPSIRQRISSSKNLLLGSVGLIGKELGSGVQTGNLTNSERRTVELAILRNNDGITAKFKQTGLNGIFDFMADDNNEIVTSFNSLVIALDDSPELVDWLYVHSIKVEKCDLVNPIQDEFNVNVVDGSSDFEDYTQGDLVTITADDRTQDGLAFMSWRGDVEFNDSTSMSTTFSMPGNHVTITAIYRDLGQVSNATIVNGTFASSNNTALSIEAGATVEVKTLNADAPNSNMIFDKWIATGGMVIFKDELSKSTSFIMPDSDVTITASYIQSPYTGSEIILPIEVLGPLGTTIESIDIDLGNQGTSATKLFLQVNNLSHDNKARIRFNGGSWIALTNSNGNVSVYEPDASYGGIGGGFSTIRLTVNIPQNNRKNGINTVEFQHYQNGTHAIQKISSGYRIIDLNFLTVNNSKLLDSDDFFHDEPRLWEAPEGYASQQSIDNGKDHWETIKLKDGSNQNINAKCMDCHARDGRDLKYFNYSNKSIVERSKFHGLSEIQGNEIAAYIRSLEFNAPHSARPWNPPYQPGPGTDSKPVFEWASGAGLDAVVTDEEATQAMFGASYNDIAAIDEIMETDNDLNLRELPIAVQFPDWKHWLPRVHPKDIFNNWDISVPELSYRDLLKKFEEDDLANKITLRSIFSGFANDVQNWLSANGNCNGFHDWVCKSGDGIESRKIGISAEWAKYNLALWKAVKQWEMLHTNDAEDKGGNYAQNAEKWQWPNHWFSVFQIAAHFIGDNRGTSKFSWETSVVGTYWSSIWYELQLVLNPGMRDGFVVEPVDWAYNLQHINLLGYRSGVYEPGRMFRNLIKCYQQRDKKSSVINSNTWTMREVSPWRMYGNYNGQQATFTRLNQYQSGLRAKLTSRLLNAWLNKVYDYPNHIDVWPRTSLIEYGSGDQWYKIEESSYNPSGKTNPWPGQNYFIAVDGAQGAIEAIAAWKVIAKFRDIGVDAQVLRRYAEWCNDIWPLANWEQYY